MLMKILVVIVLPHFALSLEDYIKSLSGVHEGNRVTLCMEPGRSSEECHGVIWHRYWIIVRGSCVANKPLYPIVVVRTSAADCSTMAPDTQVFGSRKIRARFLHTMFPEKDVGLICIDKPYDILDPLPNAGGTTISIFEPWLSEVFNQYPVVTPRTQSIYEHHDMLFSSPVKMFVTTVVLPLTSFIVFFLFVTFFTGSNKSTVSYKSLHNDKEDYSFA